jgi:hypothetical protein
MIIPGEFAQAVQIINPGQPSAIAAVGDGWQNNAGEFDAEGTLQSTWTWLFPPGTLVLPLAEILDVESGRWFWVSGVPEARRDLLDGQVDHVEAPTQSIFRQLLVGDVLRDADTTDHNALGDEVEGNDVHLAGVDVAITELTQQVPTTEGDLRTRHVVVGWIAAGTDVRRGDRIRVPTGGGPTEVVYTVDAVTQPIRTGLLDLRLDLTRTT